MKGTIKLIQTQGHQQIFMKSLFLVYTNYALQDLTDKKGCEDVAGSPRPPAQWFQAQGSITQGLLGGFYNKAKVVTKRPYCFRPHDGLNIALYHALSDQPAPKGTHRFC